jgi:hypothetical protein
MDENSILLGQTIKLKVIYCRDRNESLQVRIESCDIITIIACSSADGRAISSIYIYNGGDHLLRLHAGIQYTEQVTFG